MCERCPEGHRASTKCYPCGEGSPLAIRINVGQGVWTLDRNLAPTVYSSRLAAGPPGWRFKANRKAWKGLRDRGASCIGSPYFASFGKTDIREYFGSIDVDQLAALIDGIPGPKGGLMLALDWIKTWQSRDGLSGIPIGPDISGILGNIFLQPLDEALRIAGIDIMRYTDDVFAVFSTGAGAHQTQYLKVFDETASDLGLTRHIDKTRFTDSKSEAVSMISDAAISYLTNGSRGLDMTGVERLFDETMDSENPVPGHLAFSLQCFRYRQSSYAIGPLASRPAVLNLNPARSGDYLAALVQTSGDARDLTSELLSDVPDTAGEALYAHVLRAASHVSWGLSESRTFERTAADHGLATHTRGWALVTGSRTPGFEIDAATNLASNPRHPMGRAALIAHRTQPRRERLARVRHIAKVNPDLRSTCAWVTRRDV